MADLTGPPQSAQAHAQASITVVGTEEWYETGGVRLAKRQAPVGFEMTEENWSRFGRHLKGLTELQSSAHDAFLLFLGVGFGAVAGLIDWMANLDSLTWPRVIAGILLTALMLGSFGIAGVSRSMDRGLRTRVKRDADLLYDDMHDVHPFRLNK